MTLKQLRNLTMLKHERLLTILTLAKLGSPSTTSQNCGDPNARILKKPNYFRIGM